MTNQVNQYERHMAIQEAYQIHDSDEYFKARPQLECGDRRKVFYAGHIRGYQAATQSSEQRIQELTASNNQLREAGQALVDRWNTPKWKDAEHTATFIHGIEKALSSTPAQSLAEHDNEVIEKCAKACDYYAVNTFNSSSRNAAIELAVAIRNIEYEKLEGK